jgi:hypothetical protein
VQQPGEGDLLRRCVAVRGQLCGAVDDREIDSRRIEAVAEGIGAGTRREPLARPGRGGNSSAHTEPTWKAIETGTHAAEI